MSTARSPPAASKHSVMASSPSSSPSWCCSCGSRSPPTFSALVEQAPVLLSYALGFLVVAMMWVHPHHLIHAIDEVNARLLWSKINLLFWRSLTPRHRRRGPQSARRFRCRCTGLNLALCGVAFGLLRLELVRQHRDKPEMSEDHSRIQLKNLFSAFLYLMAAGLAHTSIYI